MSSLLLITTAIFYRKQIIYKQRFQALVNKNQEVVTKKENIEIVISTSKNKIELPNEIINEVLNSLEKFENKSEFLNPNVKLNLVAKRIGTNSSYLSKIINYHKQKNFANYINDLRIDYCVKQLRKDSKLRKYAIKNIAEEVGFTNVQSFSRAFYKKTGIQPSYFLKEIEKQLFKEEN